MQGLTRPVAEAEALTCGLEEKESLPWLRWVRNKGTLALAWRAGGGKGQNGTGQDGIGRDGVGWGDIRE